MFGYLGPRGTFTHQALATFHDQEGLAYPSVVAALNAVRAGQVSAALVPIENSIEGGVSATLDYLGRPDDPLQIVREVVLPVTFDLCVRPGTGLDQVNKVISHPHAIAQVRQWLSQNLPAATIDEQGSTAAAAQLVSRNVGYDAAVCARVAGALYGLDSLVRGIADNPAAQTRFVLVARPGAVPQRTGHDKTTLVAYLHADHPGALLAILQQFSVRGVNLCRLESRPTKTSLGQYCFNIDAEGHISDARINEALVGLKRICKDVLFLGSYERADGQVPAIPRGGADEDYRQAMQWVRSLGAGAAAAHS